MELSNEERELLKQYQTLSKSMPSLFNRVAVEVVPPIVFVALAFYTGQTVWYLVLIVMMVIYNVQRVLRQYKNIVKLTSISEKLIGTIDEESKT